MAIVPSKRKSTEAKVYKSNKENTLDFHFQLVTQYGHKHRGMGADCLSYKDDVTVTVDIFCKDVFDVYSQYSSHRLKSTDLKVYKSAVLDPIGIKYLIEARNLLTASYQLNPVPPTLRLGRECHYPLLVVIEREYDFDNEEFVAKCAKWIFHQVINSKKTRNCFTAFDKKRLISFKHGSHVHAVEGTVLTLQSATALESHHFDVRVVHVDAKKDFIIVEANQIVCEFPPYIEFPTPGKKYYLFGLSIGGGRSSNLSISFGVVTSPEPDRNGYITGSSGSFPGDSGGGLYS